MVYLQPPTNEFAFPALPLDPNKIIALTESLMEVGVTYGKEPGQKIEPLSLQAPELVGKSVDCSGFFRWCLFHALGQPEGYDIVDGSAQQHQQIAEAGFKTSDYDGGLLTDGAVRVAILTPEQGGGVGHILLLINGRTCESHGSKGPDRRTWSSDLYPWMSLMAVYCLTVPTE